MDCLGPGGRLIGRRRRAIVLALLLSAATAHAQSPAPPDTRPLLPPGLQVAAAPTLSHERQPQTWPQPDYFDEALKLTAMAPGQRSGALPVASLARVAALPFIVLPVQVQAFGFTAAFRAVVGARLDRALLSGGAQAGSQVDVADVYGPWVRRLDPARIDELVRMQPARRVIALYIGHDGIDQAFVTLVVRDGGGQKAAHRTVPLPERPLAAERAIAAVLPALLAETGVRLGAEASLPRAEPACSAEAWALGATSSDASPTRRACDAIAIATLLPWFAPESFGEFEPTLSPAKLAWLARAYVNGDVGASAPAIAIRDLAARQMAFVGDAPMTPTAVYTSWTDPVVGRVARLLALEEPTRSPARSARDERRGRAARIADALPPLAAAAVLARTTTADSFERVDICAIESAYPGPLMRGACPTRSPQGASGGREPSSAELALYQEWRLAYYDQELAYYGRALGKRSGVDAVLRDLPADVGVHPLLQRRRVEFDERLGQAASFDDHVARAREAALRTVQSVIDLQRYDAWLSGYSLTEHIGGNLRVFNDAQIVAASNAELRLLEVLRWDRFAAPHKVEVRRKPGDKAYFLVEPAIHVRMLAMLAGLPPAYNVTRPVSQAAAAPPVPAPTPTPGGPGRMFPPRAEMFEPLPIEVQRKKVSEVPMHMQGRVDLAMATLKAGGALPEARQVIDARPGEQRTDSRIAESHAWADPAHAFFFSGEIAAARDYYERVARIGTGSDSDLLAQVRLPLIDGRLSAALDVSQRRLERYGSDFSRRDVAGLLFMFGRADEAWSTLLRSAGSGATLQLWNAALTGHRMAGMNLQAVDQWLTTHHLENVEIRFSDLTDLYLHLHAVVDRLPSDADIAFLERAKPRGRPVDDVWAVSARLVRSALDGSRQGEAHRLAIRSLGGRGGNQRELFMMPLYAWIAAQDGGAKEDALKEVRDTTLNGRFDGLLAKSMLLATEGDVNESLRYFESARYDLYTLGRGELVDRAIPAPYQYALAGYLMFKRTGNPAYRTRTLKFVRAYQSVHPFLGWLYGMEAALQQDPKERLTAACRARRLDPGSYFLSLAKVEGLGDRACAGSLWKTRD